MSRNVAFDKLLACITAHLTRSEDIVGFGDIDIDEVARKYKSLTAKMLAIYEAKDTDYSENDLPMGNFRESFNLGIPSWKGILLRIGDKKRRIGSFVKRAAYLVNDEGVDDTLVDLANYSLLGLVLWDEVYSVAIANGHMINDPQIDYATWQDTRVAWLELAIFSLQAKLYYEYRDVPNVESWAGGSWQNVNEYYDQLSMFARNNNHMNKDEIN